MSYSTLEQWEALPPAERESLMAGWDIYRGGGYWEKLFEQAVEELRRKFAGDDTVTRIFSANHHGRLEVCVETLRGAPALPGFDNFRTTYRGLPVRQVSA
jgi:hypothetical protein